MVALEEGNCERDRTGFIAVGCTRDPIALLTCGNPKIGVPRQALAKSAIFCDWSLPLMLDEILTLPEVAQLLKVAEKTVYTMAQKGVLPAFKVGGQWRFRRADLDAWIDAKTRRAAGMEESK